MHENVKGGTAMAARLAGGAPLRSALVVTDPAEWLALDGGVREVTCFRSDLMPERAAPLPADLWQLGESRLALALCHRDGRIRQRALHGVAHYPSLLPLIVIRCADWVEPVRERAREVLREALDAEPDAAVDLASLILRVGRRDKGAFCVDLLEEILGRHPRGRVAALFSERDRMVRRFAYRLAIEHQLLRPAQLARAAARDDDSVVQDLCATAALASVPEGDADDEVLTPLLTARNPRTRSAGVTALRRAGRPEPTEAFLSDPSALVRACARYVVRQHGGDPAAWYRLRCAASDDPELPAGAVIGLAECGSRADAHLLWPLLAHPAPAVRARAVAGLRTLDVASAERLRPLLDDPAAGVVRETVLALLPSAKELASDRLLERTGPNAPE